MALLWWATGSLLTAMMFVTHKAMHCRGLKLHLCDLGPPTELNRLYPGAQLDKGVEITYEKIVGYMREAEDERETVRDIPAPPANTRKRPRSVSSADDLDIQMNPSTSAREKDRRCFIS